MAARKPDKTRRRNRKARTEVSSESSSSSDSDDLPSPGAQNARGTRRKNQPKTTRNDHDDDKASNADTGDSSASPSSAHEAAEAVPPAPGRQPLDAEHTFDEFYLRKATQEFANDLEKLRSAGDFNEKSVDVLIEALKQGKACFTPEERRSIALSSK